MQEQISKIELVLENCECITIDGKYIGHLIIEDIKRSINRVACNTIFDMSSCGHFSISIHRGADKDTSNGDRLFSDYAPLSRIVSYPDITSIYVHFTNTKVEQFYVKWSDDEYNNQYQKSHINKFGDLFIVIDENISLDDVFEMDEIEDFEHMDFTWRMYS